MIGPATYTAGAIRRHSQRPSPPGISIIAILTVDQVLHGEDGASLCWRNRWCRRAGDEPVRAPRRRVVRSPMARAWGVEPMTTRRRDPPKPHAHIQPTARGVEAQAVRSQFPAEGP